MALSPLDIAWILLCAILVFVMQAGFLCLESGLTRTKNAINVAIKNVADFAVAVSLFWMFGFALMFGHSYLGWIGTTEFLAQVGQGSDPGYAAFFVFQAMFCATAATIVSGAVAERMRFTAYLLVAAIVGGLIYPVFGHWAWGGILGGEAGWLAERGFVDFAGSTVVHSVGGWVALAAVLVIGPRVGRFAPNGKGQVFTPGNLPLAMLGALLLILGWFGFNGGSALTLDGSVPGILANTVLAAVAGILMALFLGWRARGYAEILYTLNGAIAGLVAITAGAHAVSASQAVLIGMVGGMLMVLGHEWLLRRQVDDAVGAVSAHLVAGIWGTMAVGLFGDLSVLDTGLSRSDQLLVQALGIVVCGLWSFSLAYAFLSGINRFFPLRVDAEAEHLGLNVAEHGARSDLNELLQAMEAQERTHDLRLRVPVEPFTEVGQIASRYNRVMDALERAMDHTQAIIRDVRDGVVTVGQDGLIRSFNPGAEKLFGVAATEAIGRPMSRLLAPGLADPVLHTTDPGWNPGKRLELRIRHPKASARYVEIAVSESRLGNERLLTGLVRDVSERRQILEQLQSQRDLAQVTLASIGDGVITTDETGVIRYINPVAERLTGWSLDEAKGQRIIQVYCLESELTGERLENPVRYVLTHSREVRRHEHAMLIRRDGQSVPVHDTAAPIRNRHGHLIGVVLIFNDVTVTLNLTRELTRQASHDALTGVPNRREFERRLEDLLHTPRDPKCTDVLCYLDLDQFKVVNDTCGHVAGDELLRQVTTLLRDRLRASDWVARLGGDEFGILFHCCPIAKAEEMAEGLREMIQDYRFAWEGNTFAIGVSIGLVPIRGEDRDLAVLLSAADTACYAAKEAGRNRLHVYHVNDDEVLRQHGQMQWVTRLHAALDQDRLRLYAQPIVSLKKTRGALSEEPPHYEILVRIEEDDGRIISPGAFIPAAERYGIMGLVDTWVFSNTLAWLSDYFRKADTPRGMFSINLSGTSLSDARFRRSVVSYLQRAALPPGAVCIEITESSAIANLTKVVEFITEVKDLGCLFALDDFGSGLSSFAYLKNLPVDFLKIDGGFVKDILSDPTDWAMVQSINTIGHTMGLKTIAEFVESEGIMLRLAEIGVDYAQGYHIGRPVPLLEFEQVRMMPR